MNWFDTFFSWPSGGVWSNEVANVLWIPVVSIWGWRKYLRHQHKLHREKMEQSERHHRAVLKEIRKNK